MKASRGRSISKGITVRSITGILQSRCRNDQCGENHGTAGGYSDQHRAGHLCDQLSAAQDHTECVVLVRLGLPDGYESCLADRTQGLAVEYDEHCELYGGLSDD